jgi:hypothetical protein
VTSQTKPCKECGSETTITTLAPFSGREGPVTVTVDGMPALVCARNHRRFLYAEFAPTLLDFVADSGNISPRPPAEKRGLLRKRYHCGECGAELPVASAQASERSLDAAFRKGSPFKVLVQIEVYACEQCGREHVRPRDELADSAMKAVSHGFRAADIHADR